ncbi:hypothetical protein [Pseudoalteromonas sp. MelDa3]|uniref:hypothetical protein n=1 Tax=Pseudoalteromonas sp. MelDa3 TaxID=888435 RepID=UPI000CA6A04B|nr:hypothetical protein [Pseudoalteromonas sp. MelDa3]PLT26696.1 hypothetical protein CXF89_03835 [Pseudoalteromonas sp. MelDa3]
MSKNLFTKAIDLVSGGFGSSVVEAVKDYFPPSMSEQEKAELSFRIQTATDQKALKVQELNNEAQAEFNRRIAELEGTAKDLKSIPVLGPLMLFLRGCQRPVWGYSTLYIDFNVFSGAWTGLTDTQESALWIINFLVLAFLFGERAMKNVTPLIERIIKTKLGNKNA